MCERVAAEVPIQLTPSRRMSRFSFLRNSLTLLVVALLLAENAPSVSAVKHCKNALMDVIMKHCSGARVARDLEHVRSPANPEDVPEEAEASVANTNKRQTSDAASAIAAAAPVVMDILKGNNGAYPRQFNDPSQFPYPMMPGNHYPPGGLPPYGGYGLPGAYGPPGTYDPPGIYGPPGGYGGFGSYGPGLQGRFQAAGDDLGMDLTSNEVEELYKVYERMPRASMRKEEAKKLFIEMAAKCCQNLNHCVLDEKLVPCT